MIDDELDKPTKLTRDDIDKFFEMCMNHEIKMHNCFKCGKEFLPNYDIEKCDECFFSQFSKKTRMAYFQSIIDEML